MVELLRVARRAPERLLHSMRRRSAQLAAGTRPAPRSVLVVCYGNICRSPFAEAILRRLLGPAGPAVESAGLFGPGRPSPAAALEAAGRRGVDLAAHRARLLTPALARGADLIVVMEEAQKRAVCARFGRHPQDVLHLGDFDPLPIERRDIEDPVERPVAVFARVYERIARCAAVLAAALARDRRAADLTA